MKTSSSKERIQMLMDEFHLNQTDFCNKTKIQKSALSNYLKGDRVPRQDQISKIADAFGISASWLMGYDVPMYEPAASADSVDTYKVHLLRYYELLNEEGKKRLLEQARFFASQDEYKETKSGESAG